MKFGELDAILAPKVNSKNTFDNYAWASDKAHNLRYDAVFEMHPRTNYIV